VLNLYLDTNIPLSFFGLSSDDLEELRKLAALARAKQVQLFLPQQTEEEFVRNRPAKIAEALKRLSDQRLTLHVPQIAMEYPAFEELKRLQRDLGKAHSRLVADLASDIEGSRLKADAIVAELFALAARIPTTAVLLERARLRHELGNPPGKRDSLGDALNWEALLSALPHGEDLVFVTDDGDYASPLGEAQFHPFLSDEWRRTKLSDVRFFRRLSDFFVDTYPEIKLATDVEKDRLIRQLAQSSCFAETHSVVAQLARHADYSVAQRNDILRGAVGNSQVSWIILDEDVREFIATVTREQEARLDSALVAGVSAILQGALEEQSKRERPAPPKVDGDDDLPF